MSRCFPFPPPNYHKEEKTLTESIKLQKEREASKEKRTEKEKGKQEKRTEKERGKKEKRERANEDKNEISKDWERAYKKRKHNQTSEQRMKEGSHGLHMNATDACKMVAVKKNEPHVKDTCKIASAEDVNMKGVFQEAAVKMIEAHAKDAFQKAAVKMNVVRMKDLDHQKGAVKDVPKDASQDKMNEVHVKCVSHRKAAVKDGAEQLERSWLTEEHGVPCRAPEPCESSESTQNSSKGRRPDATASSHQGGTIIRLKLPLQKHKGPKPTVITSSEEPCLSGRTISKDPEPTVAENEVPSFSGRVTEAPTETQLAESSKRRRDREKKFRDLIASWNPMPSLAADDAADDLGWLLGNSQQSRESSEAKSRIVGGSGADVTCGSAACSFQPRAGYLPELEMYQMPYAIPF